MLNRYAELVVTIPGKGTQVLYRTNTYGRCISERSNRALRMFNGHRVRVQESVTSRCEPMGWIASVGGRHGNH